MILPSILILIGEFDEKNRSEAFFSTMSLNSGFVFRTKLRAVSPPTMPVSPSSRSCGGVVAFQVGDLGCHHSSSSTILSAPDSSRCGERSRLLSSLMRSRISFLESALRSASS